MEDNPQIWKKIEMRTINFIFFSFLYRLISPSFIPSLAKHLSLLSLSQLSPPCPTLPHPAASSRSSTLLLLITFSSLPSPPMLPSFLPHPASHLPSPLLTCAVSQRWAGAAELSRAGRPLHPTTTSTITHHHTSPPRRQTSPPRRHSSPQLSTALQLSTEPRTAQRGIEPWSLPLAWPESASGPLLPSLLQRPARCCVLRRAF